MSDEEIVWEAPPSRRAAIREQLQETLQQVKEHPGQWARLGVWPSPSTAYNRRGTLGRMTANDPAWEVRAAKLPDGQYGVFARYNKKR